MDLLVGRRLVKRLGNSEVLKDVSIVIPQGAAVAIAGATGSGKSTMLKILAGLVEPDEGNVELAGKKVEGPISKLIPGHDRIAYLSQYFELRNNYRVEEIFDYSNKMQEAEAEQIFRMCNVSQLLKRRTDQLSGGERQRIALARVLLTRPEVLLLDEPYSNLDLIQKTALKTALTAVITAFKLTVVLVSHDPADILSFADIVHVMKNGRIVQTGTPSQLYYYPSDDYVAGLLGQYTVADKKLLDLLNAGDGFPGSKKFLRPEMFLIEKTFPGASNGIVEDNYLIGPYWQARVKLDGHTLICNYNDLTLQPGDAVRVTLVN